MVNFVSLQVWTRFEGHFGRLKKALEEVQYPCKELALVPRVWLLGSQNKL